MEKCFVMLKPGVLQRRLVGEIITRFEKKGMKLIGMKMMNVSEDLAKKHYAEHEGKSFYGELISYIISAPVVAMVFEADGCVAAVRRLTGPTNVEDQKPGTIRGDYCIHMGMNVIHASDSPENAQREVSLWFKEEELCIWDDFTGEKWI